MQMNLVRRHLVSHSLLAHTKNIQDSEQCSGQLEALHYLISTVWRDNLVESIKNTRPYYQLMRFGRRRRGDSGTLRSTVTPIKWLHCILIRRVYMKAMYRFRVNTGGINWKQNIVNRFSKDQEFYSWDEF